MAEKSEDRYVIVTFLYSIGLVALAEAPSETPADEIIANIPQTNIGKASLSVIFLVAIISLQLFRILVFMLLPSGDTVLVQHLGGG